MLLISWDAKKLYSWNAYTEWALGHNDEGQVQAQEGKKSLPSRHQDCCDCGYSPKMLINIREKTKTSPDVHVCSLPYLNGMTSSIGHIPMLLKPPSTAIHCPVMYEAAGDARNATSPTVHSCQHIQRLHMPCLLVLYRHEVKAQEIWQTSKPSHWESIEDGMFFQNA